MKQAQLVVAVAKRAVKRFDIGELVDRDVPLEQVEGSQRRLEAQDSPGFLRSPRRHDRVQPKACTDIDDRRAGSHVLRKLYQFAIVQLAVSENQLRDSAPFRRNFDRDTIGRELDPCQVVA